MLTQSLPDWRDDLVEVLQYLRDNEDLEDHLDDLKPLPGTTQEEYVFLLERYQQRNTDDLAMFSTGSVLCAVTRLWYRWHSFIVERHCGAKLPIFEGYRSPSPSRRDIEAIQEGFGSEAQRFDMIKSLSLYDRPAIDAFIKWRDEDGTKAGLKKLLEVQGDQRATESVLD